MKVKITAKSCVGLQRVAHPSEGTVLIADNEFELLSQKANTRISRGDHLKFLFSTKTAKLQLYRRRTISQVHKIKIKQPRRIGSYEPYFVETTAHRNATKTFVKSTCPEFRLNEPSKINTGQWDTFPLSQMFHFVLTHNQAKKPSTIAAKQSKPEPFSSAPKSTEAEPTPEMKT